MILGVVAGEITSTVNHPFYDGRKLLVVARIDPSGTPLPDSVIAVDVVGAGVGERVLVNDEGNGARGVLRSPDGPVRSVVVAIVDAVDLTTRD